MASPVNYDHDKLGLRRYYTVLPHRLLVSVCTSGSVSEVQKEGR